jgi:hypothetical protein
MSRISISGIVIASLLTCGCATIPLPQKVPMADGADDAASKQFSPAPGKANIYVAKTSIVGSRYAVPVFLDGKAAGMVGLNSHLLLEVAPGKHVVMVVTPENQHSLAVSVGSGENRFFEVAAKMGTVYARAFPRARESRQFCRPGARRNLLRIPPRRRIWRRPAPAVRTRIRCSGGRFPIRRAGAWKRRIRIS